MAYRRPSRFTWLLALALAAGLAAWTWLRLTSSDLAAWADANRHPPLTRHALLTQIMETVAMISWPGVVYLALAIVAIWAVRRRLRNLAFSVLLAIALSYGGYELIKHLTDLPRPSGSWPLVTTSGSTYPSGHMSAITTAFVMIVTTTTTTRQRLRTIWLWRIGGLLLILLVAFNRWYLSAHWLSDLPGGLLWGALAATLAVMIAGVHVIPDPFGVDTRRRRAGPGKRCAVVVNPTKVIDIGAFRRHVNAVADERGWGDPLWLDTTRDDPGRAMTKLALDRGVDLVLAAGGDGTVRVVCDGLAGTGVPLGLIAAGTGNLLAKNLGVPLDQAAALDVAFSGTATEIDLVRITVDDDAEHAEHSAVMAGIGVDAVILEGTNSDLKKAFGSAAYFMAAAQNAGHPPIHMEITVDDDEVLTRDAAVAVVGNVGFLQANIQMIPDASPHDGLLDLAVASPRTVADWATIVTRVLTRGEDSERLDRRQGTTVRIECAEPTPYQLDGDTAGEASVLQAEVVPRALTIMVPGVSASSAHAQGGNRTG